jgi:hypothetical protein
VRNSLAARSTKSALCIAVLATALASCRGSRDAAAPGEGESTVAGPGKRLEYCCVHEEARPSSPAARAYPTCESRVFTCTSDDGEYKSTRPLPFDARWTDEIRRVRRAGWCCYSWRVALPQEQD